MKIIGILESVEIHYSVATVVIVSAGRSYYLHAEPRMLVIAFEECWPDGDWKDQRVICECDGPLLISFSPDTATDDEELAGSSPVGDPPHSILIELSEAEVAWLDVLAADRGGETIEECAADLLRGALLRRFV